jgi:phosphoglycerate dehydrogenase-like enzyme
MTGVLVSKRVADGYGRRITEIAHRCNRQLDILVFSLEAPLSAGQREKIEIAFYSRDVWEGTDKTYINPQTLAFFEEVDRAPRLEWLQVTSAGADLPYYQPSLERGVRVSTSSGSNAEPIAQTAVASILALARGLYYWIAAQRRREWVPLRGEAQPRDLAGQKAVIVGTGPIGKGIARLLRAVGLHTIGIRRTPTPTEPFDAITTYERIDDVLPEVDWLVIACPLTETTQGLIDGRRIALLPRTAHVVNVARGEIVDEAALTDALAQGRLAGAYLDVFAVEPLPADSSLWDMPNVIITPHNCSASLGNYPRGVEIFLRNLEAYLSGRPLENEVSGQGGRLAI